MTSPNHPPLRSSRRMLLALACAVALAAPALAQEPSTPPPPPSQQQGPHGRGGEMQQHQLEHMTRALNLTPDQVTQIKAIQDDGRRQMTALHDDQSASGPDRHAKMMSLRQAQETRIKGVLNDDQKSKFDQMLAKQREHNQERHDKHEGGDQAPLPPPPAA